MRTGSQQRVGHSPSLQYYRPATAGLDGWIAPDEPSLRAMAHSPANLQTWRSGPGFMHDPFAHTHARHAMNGRWILAAGGLLVALATLSGAFGAHALETRLTPERLSIYETAVRYQFFHALGLLAIGLLARTNDTALLRWSAILILVGIILFSGSIYALSFGAPRPLGVITPVGGLALITGWIVFAVAVLRS
jgi:uncharacterized membrane protein YgdD (TMEM256/DUF423 family)